MLKFSVQAGVKGMFVGNANNSTNSISKALGVFILFSWTRAKVGSDEVFLSVYVNVACSLQFLMNISLTQLKTKVFMANFLVLLPYY